MSLYDVAIYGSVALLIAAMFYLPRKISARRRLRVGLVLFVVGWTGVLLLTLRFSDLPVPQSETAAYALIGPFYGAILVGGLFLLTAFFDWLGFTRPRRQRRRFPPFDS